MAWVKIRGYAKDLIEKAGGEFIGTIPIPKLKRKDIEGDYLIMFNTKKNHTTLSIKASELKIDKVKQMIEDSDKQFKKET